MSFTSRLKTTSGALVLSLFLTAISAAQDSKGTSLDSAILGRWDVTVSGKNGEYPSWFEFVRSGRRSVVGSYVGEFGSARPVSKVEFENAKFRFVVPPQWEDRKIDVLVEGKLDGDLLSGEVTGDMGERLQWKARRAPTLESAAPGKWTEPVSLLNQRDLTALWKPRNADKKQGWQVRDGVLVNAEPGNDLVSQKTFKDFKLHAEFRFPKGSNSGLYLRGRYEVQIEDNFGQPADSHRFGGVYGFLTPNANVSKPAGEWQTYDITLIGRQVTVVLNGERIIDRQSIPGITGGALDSNEAEPGPIMIQGDHGQVEFRVLTISVPQP